MIIVDTNVVSEAMRPVPAAQVLGWLAAQPVSEVRTTVITEAEILSGIARMPEGRRRRQFQERAELMFRTYFEEGILPFDSQSARHFATILEGRLKQGRPMEPLDAQIAAIVRLHNATLATRNTRDFEGCGIRVVNPWEA